MVSHQIKLLFSYYLLEKWTVLNMNENGRLLAPVSFIVNLTFCDLLCPDTLTLTTPLTFLRLFCTEIE